MDNRLVLIAVLALAACGSPPTRAPVDGQLARAKVDAATNDYANCLDTTVKRLATPTTQAADAADATFKECMPVRAKLVAEVSKFRRIGAPKESAEYNTAVAEQSVLAIETDLRSQTVVTAVSTKLDQEKAQ
ncbi:hypothetical protein KZX46_06035 [Polymorphobacter sp. PAMC 29334]|uniref:hypothetical protein n=1 Tax=Polymorphobacter sp. PAMC 29334 TaxID=2862331 RepID=UPI001C762F15|nr:hypothetical protein [Polymorphobacter sp. PAMC 29334]QYE35532.1 hypothetical protein KZX46_06035 [Polymorphobacter sp. PAMC 29334]